MNFEEIQSAKGRIQIKPYFDSRVSNMGLENYSMVLFDGAEHTESVKQLEKNGTVRYITGLNPDAPEITMLDLEDREPILSEMRKIVAYFEAALNSKKLDPNVDDVEFWNSVELLKSNNSDFWDKISITMGNEPKTLQINQNPHDMLLYIIIKSNGFDFIAPSFEDARAASRPPKFYLEEGFSAVENKVNLSIVKDRAAAKLLSLYDGNKNKLLYVAKVADPNGAQYTKSTPLSVLYDAMKKYIDGDGVNTEDSKRKVSQEFLKLEKMTIKALKLKALVKDAIFYKEIFFKPEGYFVFKTGGHQMGKTIKDVEAYLDNPINQDVLEQVISTVEPRWEK